MKHVQDDWCLHTPLTQSYNGVDILPVLVGDGDCGHRGTPIVMNMLKNFLFVTVGMQESLSVHSETPRDSTE